MSIVVHGVLEDQSNDPPDALDVVIGLSGTATASHVTVRASDCTASPL